MAVKEISKEEVEYQQLIQQIDHLKNLLTTGNGMDALLCSVSLTRQLRERWISSKK